MNIGLVPRTGQEKHGRDGRRGYADRRSRFLPLTCHFRLPTSSSSLRPGSATLVPTGIGDALVRRVGLSVDAVGVDLEHDYDVVPGVAGHPGQSCLQSEAAPPRYGRRNSARRHWVGDGLVRSARARRPSDRRGRAVCGQVRSRPLISGLPTSSPMLPDESPFPKGAQTPANGIGR